MPKDEDGLLGNALVVICISRLPYRDWTAREKWVDENQVRMFARSSRSGLSWLCGFKVMPCC
jgi:hypothetical protein